MVRSFEPEPVTVTVIGAVIIVGDALTGKGLDQLRLMVAMRTPMIKSTSTKTLELGNGTGNGLGLGTTQTEPMISCFWCGCSLS